MYINWGKREITAKIVYYGPGFGGKTTNINKIYEFTPEKNRTNLENINTEGDPTIFFDYLQTTHNVLENWKVRVQLYTVPGQSEYVASRKMLLKRTDGVVFVADSDDGKEEENLTARKELETFLKENGDDLNKLPYCLQLNKRDLGNAMPVEDMIASLRIKDEPVIEASAVNGLGVKETNEAIMEMVLEDIKNSLKE